MNKLLQIGALVCCMMFASTAFAQDAANCCPPAQDQCCPAEHPAEGQSTGDCWCKMVRYKPCYYTTKRCVEEQIPCTKTCCRMVPKYYEVQRCRYVPQYYCETCCRNEPEYYQVPDCKTCKKWVCDQHCQYVPEYYWKHTCGDANCTTPCPQ